MKNGQFCQGSLAASCHLTPKNCLLLPVAVVAGRAHGKLGEHCGVRATAFSVRRAGRAANVDSRAPVCSFCPCIKSRADAPPTCQSGQGGFRVAEMWSVFRQPSGLLPHTSGFLVGAHPIERPMVNKIDDDEVLASRMGSSMASSWT